ncbi:SGNH/GDSL hydrolase family protein [Tardiphaga sp. P9-11]|jgi:lysophospholipase L1-like esterase|uniref:SGNH/GDSL hydrolase family protein n=1 Tax=Tardiphaga sp. P9-11 TaxID=2024614 RepID=UPI0011F222FD|nr:SGNH/GDSL hydrolase family protein [Tardiphaga sp. P9-11]KAA0077566.1 SGNH/GDSL hydrolase family protein [Tardiphaga sp. P9-11]
MSFVSHLSRLAVVAAFVASTTFALPISSSARADTVQAAAVDGKAAEQAAVATDPADAAKRGVAAKAIDKVKEVAKSATDILSRVPCRTPKGGMKAMGALPHVASKLVAGKPVVIVAFGSSSTQGWGSTAPEFTYPNRLAAQLHRAYPSANITVLNRGKGGEDAPEMMARLQSEVINAKPDLVIWQVGTNAVLRNLDPAETGKMIEDGVGRIQAAGSDVVLVDPQYSPATTSKPEGTGKMLSLMHKVAELRKVGIFPRFEVMKEWHESQQMAFDSFVISDGLHMNDWGYACFAQLLGDNIIKSVGQVKLGINEPQIQQAQKPL